jgi:hypothetical protein
MGFGTKDYCAGNGQQQFSRQTVSQSVSQPAPLRELVAEGSQSHQTVKYGRKIW